MQRTVYFEVEAGATVFTVERWAFAIDGPEEMLSRVALVWTQPDQDPKVILLAKRPLEEVIAAMEDAMA